MEGSGLFLPIEVDVEGVMMGFSAYLLNKKKFGIQVWRQIDNHKNQTNSQKPNLNYQLIYNSKAISGIAIRKESVSKN